MSILLLLIFLIFNIANSTLYNFKKGSEYEKIYSNYIQELNDNNQFECSGRYFYHNYKNRTIDSNLFSGIIIRNDRDSISKRSYLIDFDEKIFYYNNYKSYIYNKDNKTIQYDRAINSIKRIKREIDVDWNIFYDFIDKSQNSIDKKLDTNTNNKFLYDSDEIDHSFIYNKYMDKYGFNWIIREKFTKNNYYPTYYYMNINGYTKLPRFEEWLIDDFEMKKDVDTSKINFDKYINQYPIYEEFAYKRKACTFNDKLEGNLVFDVNLKKSRLKLVAFYQDSENLNSKLLEEDLKLLNNEFPKLVYKYENDSLKLENNISKIEEVEIFSQYNVNVMPCFYILDENNKIIKYFYGYNNNIRIDFNKYIGELKSK